MFTRHQFNQFRMALAAVLCFTLFWGIGAAFGIPDHRNVPAVMLIQANPVINFLLIALGLLGSLLIGTLIAGSVRIDAGLFAGCVGLSALSMRGVSIGAVLRGAEGSSIFLTLAVELLILALFISLAWTLLWWLKRKGWLAGGEPADQIDETPVPLGQKISAALAMMLGMVIMMALICQNGDKAQTLAAVALGGFAAAASAYTLFPLRPSLWFWIGPLIVGIGGYFGTFFSPGSDWMTGYLAGYFAPLSRALPLDYASLGTAGAILGYWMGRQWHHARVEQEAEKQATSGHKA